MTQEVSNGVRVESMCGLLCSVCEYNANCKGCMNLKGNQFWGVCPVATCCIGKKVVHCGECEEVPCDLLTTFSCDEENGDNPHGKRIEQCKRWHEKTKITLISGLISCYCL